MGKLLVSGSMQSTNKLFVGSSSNDETSPGVGIHVWDIRDGTITPNSFGDQSINFYFDQEVDGDWKSIMHIKGWTGDYAAWQIAAQASNSATESNSLYFRTGIKSSWNSWHTLLDNKNYTSYTVTKTGSGASGTWGINISGNAAYATSASRLYSIDNSYKYDSANPYYGYLTYSAPYWDFKVSPATPADVRVSRAYTAGTADHAYYLNTVAGNEIRIHNATGLTAGGSLWLGWAWADGNKTVTKDWYIGNFSGGGLANVYASTFNGALNGNATSANYAESAGSTGWATQANSVYGPYSGNGGNQVPSYIGTNTTRFAMMRNFGSSDIGGYMDCILMNNYVWADVPYATGLGITKVNGYPRAIIANGPKTGWAYATELVTTYNYSWWCLPLSGGTMTGNLKISTHGNTMTIGSLNSAWCHFQSSADIPFYFNRRVFVDGCLGIYEMNSQGCGSSFPSSPTRGQIFFKI